MIDDMAEIDTYYKNKDNCYKDLTIAREYFCNVNTTEKEYDQLEKTLGIMLVRCPLDVRDTVSAVILEATYRRFYFECNWKINT